MKSLRADTANLETCRILMDAQLDIIGAEVVQVQRTPNGDRLWVNVNGVCVLRICQIPEAALRYDPPCK